MEKCVRNFRAFVEHVKGSAFYWALVHVVWQLAFNCLPVNFENPITPQRSRQTAQISFQLHIVFKRRIQYC